MSFDANTEQLNISSADKLLGVVAAVFVLDETILPVFHFGGLSIKISYVILLIWLLFNLFRMQAGVGADSINAQFTQWSASKSIFTRFWLLILLSCVGELTMRIFSSATDTTPFTDAIKYYLFMLSAFGLGYTCFKFNKKILLYALYGYSLINIGLLMFYSSLPGFIRTLYGEYFNTGIRIRGTGGNANTTLLVMNCILLAIVLTHRVGLLKIKGVHLWLVLLVPIITNVIISSRGEFVHTVVLELFYVYNMLKNEPNKTKTLVRVVILIAALIAAYYFVFGYLYNTNANVKYGIDRLMTLSSVDDEELKDVDTLLRPFIKIDRFWERFHYSPIWGAGYSYGSAEDFIKSATGYHNDWFRVLASTGILGFALWFMNEKKFYSVAGICVLLPVCIAGLTNTFIQSVHAFNIYFFIMGVLMHYSEYGICKKSW